MLPTIHKQFSLLIGPNDAVCYAILNIPPYGGLKIHFKWSNKGIVHTLIAKFFFNVIAI